MNTYVLVQKKDKTIHWYERLSEKKEESIEKIISRLTHNMAVQYLHGRVGLTLDNMDSFLCQFRQNIERYLEEGKVLLFNRVGAMTFLEKDSLVIKTLCDTAFPYQKEGFGLSGWLTPEGEFYPCEHGEHWKFAKENLKKQDKLQELQYISMGSLGYELEKTSHLFLPLNGLTPKQEKWFEEHYEYLDPQQKKIVDLAKGVKING